MPEVVTAALAIGGAIAGGVGASKQAGANRDAAEITAGLAQNFGKEQLAKLDELDFNPVDLLSLLDEADQLIDFGYDTSREKAYGAGNVDKVDQLQADALARANYDFSSLPADILDAMDNGILARTAGGPAGQAENLSVQNRIALAEAGFNQFNALASNNTQFTPNPVGTVFDIAKFNVGQQQFDLEFDFRKLQQELSVEEFKFNALVGAVNQRAANDASAVNWTAASSILTSAGQAVSSGGLSSALNGASASMQGTSANLISSITGR